MRVETTDLPTDNWHHFLRLRDLRQIMAVERPDRSTHVLELGAGDGVQTAARLATSKEWSLQMLPTCHLKTTLSI